MAKYVKLGDKALSFYDPNSKLKLTPGVIVKLEKESRKSKRVMKAIGTGHLQYSTEEAFKKQGKSKTGKTQNVDPDAWKAEVIYEEAKLKKLNNDKLQQLAVDLKTELTTEELADAKKAELINEILDLKED